MSGVNLQMLRELAEAVDKDRGHDKSLLTRAIRQAADELELLRESEAEWQRRRDRALQAEEALRLATWDLANHTFRGRDVSLGEEAAALYVEYQVRAANSQEPLAREAANGQPGSGA